MILFSTTVYTTITQQHTAVSCAVSNIPGWYSLLAAAVILWKTYSGKLPSGKLRPLLNVPDKEPCSATPYKKVCQFLRAVPCGPPGAAAKYGDKTQQQQLRTTDREQYTTWTDVSTSGRDITLSPAAVTVVLLPGRGCNVKHASACDIC